MFPLHGTSATLLMRMQGCAGKKAKQGVDGAGRALIHSKG